MKKIFTYIFALTVMTGAISYADLVLVADDFSASGISNENRFRPDQADNGWSKNSASLWTTSSNNLLNPGTTAGIPSEGAVGQVISITTTDISLTQLSVSFDYNVGTGSTLYFHLVGLTTNGTPDAGEILANTGAQSGSIQNNAETDYADMNLLNGTDPTGAPGNAIAFGSGTSGTYTNTFNLTGYSWSADELPGISGSIGSVADFDLLLPAFASNMTQTNGTGVISVDNFNITALSIPEPSSFVLVGLGVLLVCLGRKKAL